MTACVSIIGILMLTTGWMIGISYVDYLVARYQRFEIRQHSTVRQRLASVRVLGLPWGWSLWVASGVLALIFTTVLALIEFWLFVLLSVIVSVGLTIVIVSDLRQLQLVQTARPTAPNAWLYGIQGEYAGHCFELSRQGLDIGRARSNMLRLCDQTVSRRHARIRCAQGRFYLQDLGSRRGILLNGHQVEAHILRDGDRIAIHNDVFEFRTSMRL